MARGHATRGDWYRDTKFQSDVTFRKMEARHMPRFHSVQNSRRRWA
jgi:hypothetical protein